MVYTREQVIDYQDLARELQLEGWRRFCMLQPETVMAVCNGIGAEWMPSAARALCNKRFTVLQLPAMIHDVDYFFGTGTPEDFHEANMRLATNGITMANAMYPWYHPVRYIVRHDAKKLSSICELCGSRAYDDAIRQREQLGAI